MNKKSVLNFLLPRLVFKNQVYKTGTTHYVQLQILIYGEKVNYMHRSL